MYVCTMYYYFKENRIVIMPQSMEEQCNDVTVYIGCKGGGRVCVCVKVLNYCCLQFLVSCIGWKVGVAVGGATDPPPVKALGSIRVISHIFSPILFFISPPPPPVVVGGTQFSLVSIVGGRTEAVSAGLEVLGGGTYEKIERRGLFFGVSVD